MADEDERGPSPYTLTEQIAEVKREIALRHRLYPRWIAEARMAQPTAERQIACMTAVLHTLLAMIDDRK